MGQAVASEFWKKLVQPEPWFTVVVTEEKVYC